MKTAKDMALQKGDVVTYNSKYEGEYKCIVRTTPQPDSVWVQVAVTQTTEIKLVHIRFLKIG